jgi:ComEC/Rec2-related protein
MTGIVTAIAFVIGFVFGWWGFAAVVLITTAAFKARKLSVGLVGAILFATAIGLARSSETAVESSGLGQFGEVSGVGRVEGMPVTTALGQRFVVRVASLSTEVTRDHPLRFCVYAPGYPLVREGDDVDLRGEIASVSDLTLVGRAALQSKGCIARWSVDSITVVGRSTDPRSTIWKLRSEISSRLIELSPGDAGALMNGLVIGDDGALSTEAKAAFLSTGTTHITAVSGANFSVLILLFGLAAKGGLRRRAAFVACAASLVWLYAMLVGMSPSAIRAGLLATAVLIAIPLGRRPDFVTLTLVLACVQLVLRPSDLRSFAFQLSVASTLAIVLVFSDEGRANRSWMRSSLLAVAAAQLATIPIVMARIEEISTSGIIVNLFVGPLAALAFPLALATALCGLVSSIGGHALAVPAAIMCDVILQITKGADTLFASELETGYPSRLAIGVVTFMFIGLIGWLSPDVRLIIRRSSHHVLARRNLSDGLKYGAYAGVALGLLLVRIIR